MKKYNFLIVDDCSNNRLLLKKFIKDISDIVVEAENGLEAITLFNHQHIDIILMDIEMPVMNGFEAADYIRNKMISPKNQIPIVAVTAYNLKKHNEDFKGEQFDRLIIKPVTKETLIKEIGSLLKL